MTIIVLQKKQKKHATQQYMKMWVSLFYERVCCVLCVDFIRFELFFYLEVRAITELSRNKSNDNSNNNGNNETRLRIIYKEKKAKRNAHKKIKSNWERERTGEKRKTGNLCTISISFSKLDAMRQYTQTISVVILMCGHCTAHTHEQAGTARER